MRWLYSTVYGVSSVGQILKFWLDLPYSVIAPLYRSWYSKPGLHYLHTVPQEPSSLPYHWSSLLFTRAARDSRSECGLSSYSVYMCAVSVKKEVLFCAFIVCYIEFNCYCRALRL